MKTHQCVFFRVSHDRLCRPPGRYQQFTQTAVRAHLRVRVIAIVWDQSGMSCYSSAVSDWWFKFEGWFRMLMKQFLIWTHTHTLWGSITYKPQTHTDTQASGLNLNTEYCTANKVNKKAKETIFTWKKSNYFQVCHICITTVVPKVWGGFPGGHRYPKNDTRRQIHLNSNFFYFLSPKRIPVNHIWINMK